MLFPTFLKLGGRQVLLVGAGPVASGKLRSLLEAGAAVRVVAPDILPAVAAEPVELVRRPFEPGDLDGMSYVVAAAPPAVNREVAAAAHARGIFVNAVDDVENASAYAGAVLRKAGVTIAISTDGDAPALAGLVREALGALLPDELEGWMACARESRRQWLAAHVPMEERRPLLLTALNRLYADRAAVSGTPGWGSDGGQTGVRPPSDPLGWVSLVGAGPGDPELLTRRAARRLEEADLVLYDALVDPQVLDLAPSAQRVFVGKRAGRPAVRQAFINRLLVRAARRGRRVVRLKGGDPFVFGRGGEEALALVAAGVPFEIVPGVSSAIAAPALAGIPVTHRGTATAFVVVSGHTRDAYAAVLASLAPRSATVIVMMGLGAAHDIATLLIERGWGGDTPAAVLYGASTDAAASYVGTLGSLSQRIDGTHDRAPGTIVIGDVVRMGALLGAEMARFADGGERVADRLGALIAR